MFSIKRGRVVISKTRRCSGAVATLTPEKTSKPAPPMKRASRGRSDSVGELVSCTLQVPIVFNFSQRSKSCLKLAGFAGPIGCSFWCGQKCGHKAVI